MRYTRLKLVNFIGINNGLGKSEIEIFFPKNGKIITSLNGENGSGKSTIMSMLSPFKSSFDNRKTLIIPGKEGIKEIDIENNGHEYKIKHVYGKTTSSFISEDGIELNENGGVRTFEDIVSQKFKKMNGDYMKIAKIGSNISNFIQFSTTQRKAYISSCVEPVQKYIDAFDVVSKKAKLNEQQIKQIAADLKKYGDIENIKNKIKENETNLTSVEEKISQTSINIALLTNEITNLNNSIASVNYLNNKALLNEKEKSLKKNKQINETFNIKYGSDINLEATDKKIDELNESLTTSKNELDNIKNDIARANSSQNSIKYDIEKIKSHIVEKNNIDIDKFQSNIDVKKAELQQINDKLNNPLCEMLINEQSKISSYVSSFKNFMLIIERNYNLLNSYTLEPKTKNVDLFFGTDFSSIYSNFANNIKKLNADSKTMYEEKNTELATKNANLGQLDILNKRPKECHIDTCPFIANALQFANLPEEIKSLENYIDTIKQNMASSDRQLDELSDLRINYTEIAKAYKLMQPKDNIVYKYFIASNGKLTINIKEPLNDLNKKYNDVITEVEDIQQNLIIKHNDLDAEIKLKEVQLKQLLENEKTRLYFDSELNELNKKELDVEKELFELTNKETTLTNLIKQNTLMLSEFNAYKLSLEESVNLENDIKSLIAINTSFEENSKTKEFKLKQKDDLEKQLVTVKNDKKNITNNITNFKIAETTIESLTQNLANINKDYEDVNTVKSALNPKSGIPLIFIQSYLNGTEQIANELLNIAYDGKFEIKFVPTATDFFIQARCKENIIDDIVNASQGETAMTAVSISLALIESSMGDCNIMCLDEIDSTLDQKNRSLFIDILNKQIEKLNLEQVFIISHNNAFNDCDMNLVLLPGNTIDTSNSEFMKNKEIIYNYSDDAN